MDNDLYENFKTGAFATFIYFTGCLIAAAITSTLIKKYINDDADAADGDAVDGDDADAADGDAADGDDADAADGDDAALEAEEMVIIESALNKDIIEDLIKSVTILINTNIADSTRVSLALTLKNRLCDLIDRKIDKPNLDDIYYPLPTASEQENKIWNEIVYTVLSYDM